MGSSLPYCVFSFQSSEIGDAQQDLDDPCEQRFVSDLKKVDATRPIRNPKQ